MIIIILEMKRVDQPEVMDCTLVGLKREEEEDGE